MDIAAKISDVTAALNALQINHETVEHEEAATCAKHAEVLPDRADSAILCKNLFFKHKKKKQRWLITMSPERNLDHKAIGTLLGVGGGSLRFVNEDEMKELLGVEKGSVTPLGVSNDADNIVEVVLDQKIVNSDKLLGVHPRTCTATTFVAPADLVKFLESTSHKPKVINFDNAPAPSAASGKKPAAKKQAKKSQKPQKKATGGKVDSKKLSCTRAEDFSQWYSEVVLKSEFIELYDISGCYILRPNAMFCWTEIQHFFDINIREMGVQNAYFPMFVSEARLQAEADHVEGFTPEVAWVTRAGTTELARPIAVRPTSETVMYPAYARWIHSHRDLPLRLNQWSNIVRWEFKDPRPFIRTREFLWQEGHSAFATKEEADKEVYEILDLYARVYEELLSVAVIKGKKTEMEKFPGGDFTTTIETFIPHSGRSVQAATSHGLGQNFGKIFNIEFENQHKEKCIPFQNSWGLTTRTIGVMIMQHGDDKGLVLPPRVAFTQIVIVPIVIKLTPEQRQKLTDTANQLAADLKAKKLRAYVDDRDLYNPGWKFAHWEMRGVPLRIEIGPKDLEQNQCVLVRRDNFAKETVPMGEVNDRVPAVLDTIQADLLAKSRAMLQEKRRVTTKWEEFLSHLEERCFILAPCCNETPCEEQIKERTKLAGEEAKGDDTFTTHTGEVVQKLTGAAKTLCIPFQQPEDKAENYPCINDMCKKKAVSWTLFGRSY